MPTSHLFAENSSRPEDAMPRSTPSPATRRTAGHTLRLPPDAIAEMRAQLPGVAGKALTAIVAEVPSYEAALSDSMGENIRSAVQLALGGFLSLASGRRGSDPRTPAAPAVEGAYQLGRGEARGRPHHRRAAGRLPRSAPGCPGARCRRPPSPTASRRRCWCPSPSWSSPTSTSSLRPASPATPTSSPPPDASGNGCSSGWPGSSSPATARRPSWQPRSRPAGHCPPPSRSCSWPSPRCARPWAA